MANRVVKKKQALLTRKETLLKELQYYDKRIEEARNKKSNSCSYEDDSSDSEQDYSIDISPSGTELMLQQSMLETCLHATQELTRMQVLQSEVNIMVEDPVFEGEPPITEEGVWRDVIVECKVDHVPISMSFYAHKPNRLFAPISYRNLQVIVVKAAHEKELSKSVLSTVTTPSDTIEVIRSYACAHRSRRSTLVRLAETYADSLYMEPMSEGGYMLKCANLLEVSWTLENKWSPIAPFQHRMNFDLEYMDESYIKIITQAHKQLSDPTIDTDERTLLMAKIIKTCLEAEKSTQELHESFDSESLKEKRQTLEEPEAPIKSKDREIMAPPKYPPKKIKPKGKENVSKDKKRPSEVENGENVKRAKLVTNKDDKVTNPKNKVSNKVVKEDGKAKKSNSQVEKAGKIDNTSQSTTKNKSQKELNEDNAKTKKVNSPVDKIDQNHDEYNSNCTENKLSKGVHDHNVKAKKHGVVDKANKYDNTSKSTTNSKAQKELNDNNAKTKKVTSAVNTIDQNHDESNSNSTENKLSNGVNDNNSKAKTHAVVDKTNKNNNASKSKPINVVNNLKTSKNVNNNDLKSTSTTKKDGKTVPDPKKSNNVANSKKDNRKELDSNINKVKNVATVKNTEIKRTDVENVEKNPKNTDKTKTKPKGTDDITNNSKTTDRETVNTDTHSKNTKNSTDAQKKILNTNNEKNENQKSDKSKPLSLAERFIKNKTTTNKNNNEKQNAKLLKTTSDIKKNKISVINEHRKSKSGVNKIIKTSKIPQKRLSYGSVKKNPIRITPRKPQWNSNSVTDSSKTSIKSMQRLITNIPRLLNKPSTKTKTVM